MHVTPALLDRIYGLFERVLNQPAPAPDADLFESGTLDSLEFTNLLLVLDREFDLKLSFHNMDLECFRSLGGIARFVAAHTGLDAMLPGLGGNDADRPLLARLENSW
jgi:acyl carrier protein